MLINRASTRQSLKRGIDVVLSVILLIIHLPIMVLIFFLIPVETKQFPIFIQERAVSLQGKKIKILKFRTIKNDAGKENNNYNYSSVLGRKKSGLIIGAIGKILRRTCLDELPQLINVIKGDMSLIGPRPLSIEDLKQIEDRYPRLSYERSRMEIKPGVSGLWQVNKDDDMTVEHLVEMDKLYYSARSLLFDFYLMLKTLSIITLGRHKDALLFRTEQNPTINFGADTLSEEVYLYNLSSENYSDVRKMLSIRIKY